MKKIFYTIVFSIICASCSSSSDGANTMTELNSTPSTPILIFPAEDQLCIDNTLDFRWNAATNEDGSSLIYTLEIATDNQFNNIIVSEVQTTLSKIITLDKGLAFYWRVRARSTRGIDSEFSPISQFYTEEVPERNNLPFSPNNVAPFVGENFDGTNNIDLEWTASDVDKDPLTYNIFFGKDKDALNLVAEDTESTTLKVTADTPQTQYYWKVIAKDDKGAETSSPIWNFKVKGF
ncbi:hypothetical protein [uncultured Polaribacter sp.]|uniref:hypothetical protein n=1 Tax=uncultured Polaribacter sp. TaxID=174711 RepID=UPI00262F3472|nr:hypothetical protein [uncultured Polaribacter sp.]